MKHRILNICTCIYLSIYLSISSNYLIRSWMELGICLGDGGEGMGWKGGRWHSIAHFNKTRKHAKKYLKNVPSHSMHCEHRLHMYIYVQRLSFAQALQRRGFPFPDKW